MKKTLTSIAAIMVMASATQAPAQITNSRIVTTITNVKQNPNNSLGRDFWFAPAQNYVDEPGKYIRLYITSPHSTTAFVASQGIVKAVPVSSYTLATFDVPISWEMKSSGKVEDKAIHVYDPTDDIEVYLLSHNPYSADGMYCIPTVGWGTDYVVAGYGSLYNGSNSDDFPSEFTVTANQDNTVVEITPTCDMRLSDNYPSNDTVAGFHEGLKFEIQLNRGQSVQLQSVLPKDQNNYDVTGTAIHSNVGVCVVGASMCANIPMDFSYCNYITNMIPPTRSWGESYYTTSPSQTQPGHDFAMYLIVSSKPNQEIHRYDETTGDHIECTLASTYDHIFIEEELSNKFYSSAPFMLVQYLNSGTYPDGATGSGNPAEVAVPAKENFAQTVTFEIPSTSGNEKYVSYANVIVPINDEVKNVAKNLHGVLFDGKGVSQFAHQQIDDTFEMIVIPHLSPGVQLFQADTGFGIGVYAYGYGDNNSFAWGPSYGIETVNSPDTVAPKTVITSECYAANIHLTDSGYLPGITPLTLQSGLNEIRLDTDINMAYQPDRYPAWIDGGNFDTSGYSMYVVNEAIGAKLVVDVFDVAGNETIITSTYVPQYATLFPPLLDFGVVTPGNSAILYDTITNLGGVPFKLTQMSLLYGNRGFSIDSTGDLTIPIPVGGGRLIKLSFSPVQLTSSVDSIIFSDQCMTTDGAALIGSGGGPDFYVTDVVWKNVPLNPIPPGNWVIKGAAIHNLSTLESIQVSPAGWIPGGAGVVGSQNTLFVLVPVAQLPSWAPPGSNVFPVTVQQLDPRVNGSGIDTVYYYFEPEDGNRDTAFALWTSPQIDSTDGAQAYRSEKLIGNAVAPFITFAGSVDTTLECLDSSVHSIQLAFTISNSGTRGSIINSVTVTDPKDFTGLSGRDQHGKTWNPANPQSLPSVASDTFYVNVPIDALANSSVSTLIIADILGQNPDTLTATVNVEYASYTINPDWIDFGPVNYGSAIVPGAYTISNTGSSDVIIDTIIFAEGGTFNPSYSYTPFPPLPDTLSSGQEVVVSVLFDPSASSDSFQETMIEIFSNACNDQTVGLSGILNNLGSVAEKNSQVSSAIVTVLGDGRSIRITIPSDWTPPARLDIYNILGEQVFGTSLGGSSTFDPGKLPTGVYFYRLRTEETGQTGKILLGQ